MHIMVLGMLRTRPRLQLLLTIVLFAVLTYLLARVPDAPSFPTFPAEPEFTYPREPHAGAIAQNAPKKIAIIGAGASGSAAAWFLTRAGDVMRQRVGKEVLGEITVFERDDHVGGRSTTVYPHGDERLRPQEIGASIFVEANRHLVKAAKHFGLPLVDPDFGDAGIGIWDGTQFLFTTTVEKSRLSNYWDTLSAIRRYGPLSPLRTNRAVNALVKKFGNLYNPIFLAKRGIVDSIESFAETIGLGSDLTTRYGSDWAKSVGMKERWIKEIMESSTRVNYGRNMDQIHGLGAGVSMATSGAHAVEGGNWRIFNAMLQDSKAGVFLNTTVSDIIPESSKEEPKFRIETSGEAHDNETVYDAVFFAAPWHSSPISKSISADFDEQIPKQPYVHLHVTLLATSRSAPLPSFFGLPSDTKVPSTILTTSPSPDSGFKVDFQSITWHGETFPGSGEYTVKIFSMAPLDDSIIESLIGKSPSWLYRKEWDSYPELKPISAFAPVQPMKGFHYLGAMEPWVSTMETQTISAREAVARQVQEWWGLGLGECRGGADAWDWSCDE